MPSHSLFKIPPQRFYPHQVEENQHSRTNVIKVGNLFYMGGSNFALTVSNIGIE